MATVTHMRIVLISDTHIPHRARDLPAAVWQQVEAADVVIHAGDWVDLALLDEIQGRSKRLVGCWGNNDGPELRERLPERGGPGRGTVPSPCPPDP